ncbi:MAG TPA: NAD(P)-dependent oxidoreductase [Cytophagaceae bacterium]|jgi:saccharopine dehydrogenase (NAD+, L-lysine-forming)|nr:NAD(P)-dependent oxidoreductase [Cytophagaceae bacterium]
MASLKVGILREGKIPVDRRVLLTPDQCLEVMKRYPHIELLIQPSDVRCISNKEYAEKGLKLQEDLSGCDILLGIKEVPIHLLMANKTYLFFSHTIKKQSHNQRLFQEIAEKKITLIDYEALKDKQGNRVIAFGRFAGIVGAYNTFKLLGKKYKLFDLKNAYDCFDMADLKSQLQHVKLPPLKFVITGAGRVGKGALEIMDELGMKRVNPEVFLKLDHPTEFVYTVLSSKDYHERLDGKPFDASAFHSNPEGYRSTFPRYAFTADVLIATAYWDPAAPALFSIKDMHSPYFQIRLISDITCDIGGSIPSTVKPTNIYDPAYDFNPFTSDLEAPFSDPRNVTVMAIDNLPCELPRDASQDFGDQFIRNVLPDLMEEPYGDLITRCEVLNKGNLMPAFEYLRDYLNG